MLSAEQISSYFQNVYTYMVNVVSRANQFILGQIVYTYMVNVVSRANQFILGQNVYTYIEQNVYLLIHGECCVQSKSVHTWAKCLYLYGEWCEERNDQNVFTYMVNVVSRAIIKMFILIW